MGAHDWIGNLVQNGAISPVQLPSDVADTIAPVAIDAVTYDGQTYGVPYAVETLALLDRKSTRLNSSHVASSYAVFCLKKKTNTEKRDSYEIKQNASRKKCEIRCRLIDKR